MGSRWMSTEGEEVARPAPLPVPYPSQPLPHSPPTIVYSTKKSDPAHEENVRVYGSTMKNPEQVKYLMRAGHYQRTSPSPPLSSPPTAISPATRASGRTQPPAQAPQGPVQARTQSYTQGATHAPALNSTAQLQRKAQALASEVFEEDAEVRAEVERRTKDGSKAAKASLDFAPNEQRYVNLVPLDAPTPEPAHARRSAARPSPTAARHARTTPSITGECFERNTVSPRFGVVTRSVYVQPVTTPACDATPHPSLREYMRDHPDI